MTTSHLIPILAGRQQLTYAGNQSRRTIEHRARHVHHLSEQESFVECFLSPLTGAARPPGVTPPEGPAAAFASGAHRLDQAVAQSALGN